MRNIFRADRSTVWKPLAALSLVVTPALLHAQSDWERGFAQRYDREQWYQPGDWFADDADSMSQSSRARTYEARSTPALASSRMSPFFYYWDPEIVGWSSAIPMTGGDTAGFAGERLAHSGSGYRDSVRIQGKIDEIRWMNLYTVEGDPERHSFVRVRLENGGSRMVSLGTRAEPEDLELRKGQDIDVTGLTATVDGSQIVIADRIEVRDEHVTLVGKVADFREVSLSGTRDRNLMIRMDLSNGERSLVDLGPGTRLDDLDLETGDWIQLDGIRREIAGRSVIVANRIRVDADRAGSWPDHEDPATRRPAYTTRPPAEFPVDQE
jgi:hypothetical protein